MIEILSTVIQTAVREESWNKNFHPQAPETEIEALRRKNDAKQRWNRVAVSFELDELPASPDHV